MKLNRGIRKFSTKINTLLLRPEIRDDYPYAFLRRMTDKEIDVFLGEVKKILVDEDIHPRNINHYNRAYRYFIVEREKIFQAFMEIERTQDNYRLHRQNFLKPIGS